MRLFVPWLANDVFDGISDSLIWIAVVSVWFTLLQQRLPRSGTWSDEIQIGPEFFQQEPLEMSVSGLMDFHLDTGDRVVCLLVVVSHGDNFWWKDTSQF